MKKIFLILIMLLYAINVKAMKAQISWSYIQYELDDEVINDSLCANKNIKSIYRVTKKDNTYYYDYVRLFYKDDRVFYNMRDTVVNNSNNFYRKHEFFKTLEPLTYRRLLEYYYFGYKYLDHTDYRYYLATQELFYEEINGSDVNYVVGCTSGNTLNIDSYKQDILDHIKFYNNMPSLNNYDINGEYGDVVTIIDSKDVIKYYEISNDTKNEVVKEGNKITITLKDEGQHSIKLVRSMYKGLGKDAYYVYNSLYGLMYVVDMGDELENKVIIDIKTNIPLTDNSDIEESNNNENNINDLENTDFNQEKIEHIETSMENEEETQTSTEEGVDDAEENDPDTKNNIEDEEETQPSTEEGVDDVEENDPDTKNNIEDEDETQPSTEENADNMNDSSLNEIQNENTKNNTEVLTDVLNEENKKNITVISDFELENNLLNKDGQPKNSNVKVLYNESLKELTNNEKVKDSYYISNNNIKNKKNLKKVKSLIFIILLIVLCLLIIRRIRHIINR